MSAEVTVRWPDEVSMNVIVQDAQRQADHAGMPVRVVDAQGRTVTYVSPSRRSP